MTKSELSKLLHKLDIPVNEGITSDANLNKFPRIDYFPYLLEDLMASGDDYENQVTYQISFYSKRTMDPKLVELRQILRDEGLHPDIYIEHIDKDKVWHSYFSMGVIE